MFRNICSYKATENRFEGVEGTGELHEKEPAIVAYAKYREICKENTEETSCLYIIRLDATMTEFINLSQNAASFSANKQFNAINITQTWYISTGKATDRANAKPGVKDGTNFFDTTYMVIEFLTTADTLFSPVLCISLESIFVIDKVF